MTTATKPTTGGVLAFAKFRDYLEKQGFGVSETSGAHGRQWQVIVPGSGICLNYYPDSHKRTLIVDRRGKGANQTHAGYAPQGVIDLAHRLWEAEIKRNTSPATGLSEADAIDLREVYGGEVVKRGEKSYAVLIRQPDGSAVAMTAEGVQVYASPAHFETDAPAVAAIRIGRDGGDGAGD